MSFISKLLNKLKAVSDLVDRIKAEVPKAAPLLDALQEDNHEDAWALFSAYGDVAEVLAKVPDSAKPYIGIVGPFFMEALDQCVDEDAVEAFLKKLGLIPEPDVAPVAGE